MGTFRLGDPEGQSDLFSVAEPESALVIESLQVEVLGTLEGQYGCRRPDRPTQP